MGRKGEGCVCVCVCVFASWRGVGHPRVHGRIMGVGGRCMTHSSIRLTATQGDALYLSIASRSSESIKVKAQSQRAGRGAQVIGQSASAGKACSM